MFYKYRKRTLNTRSQTPAHTEQTKFLSFTIRCLDYMRRYTHTRAFYNIHNSHDFTLNGALQKDNFAANHLVFHAAKSHVYAKKKIEEKKTNPNMKERNISHEIYCFLNSFLRVWWFSLHLLVVFLQLISECRDIKNSNVNEEHVHFFHAILVFVSFFFRVPFTIEYINAYMHIIAHNIYFTMSSVVYSMICTFFISQDKNGESERMEREREGGKK